MVSANKKGGRNRSKKKITLVFDEDKRKEFLGGFHKRKVQRRKKAQEELQKQLKEEKKRIKHDAREQYKKLVSSRDVPELEKLLSEKEYETEEHTVRVLEVRIEDLIGDKWIGENKGTSEDKEEEPEEETDLKSDSQSSTQVKTAKELKRAIKQAALKKVKKSKVFQRKNRLEQQKNEKQNIKRRKRKEKLLKKHGGRRHRKSKH